MMYQFDKLKDGYKIEKNGSSLFGQYAFKKIKRENEDAKRVLVRCNR